MKNKKTNIRVIPLGGLGEIGKNMTLFEYAGKILIIDIGLKFPEENMPGIDFVIPNISYLKGREKDILGILITHGHYDHLGAIPYFISKMGNPPIFASPLAKGIILRRQEEFPEKIKLNIKEVKDGSKIQLNPFKVEFFRQNHSIPENLGIVIDSPAGKIVHTSDFKFDKNPVNDKPTDFKKLEEIGKSGVLLLLSDSTGAEESGHSLSEKFIEKNLEEIFKKSKGRVIAGTFASLLNRIQQILTISEKYGRKVCIEGYSMKTNVEIAQNLGYLKAKRETLISSKEVSKYPDSQVTIICTGAQGEGQAVLMRIANREHKFLRLKKGDSVIFSSSVIPGNERTVQGLKDEFYRQGIKVFHYKMMDIHAGGHGHEEELKEMINIMKPKFLMPVHGQFSMMVSHSEIAKSAGLSPKNIIIAENGQIIDIGLDGFKIEQKGVPSNNVMVDGLGIGDVGEVVLRDRQVLSKDGMFVIIAVIDKQAGKIKGSPDIISRGFIYLRESKDLLSQTRRKVIDIINHSTGGGRVVNLSYVKDEIRNKVGNFLYSKTQRRPMVLPVVIEV